MAENLEPQPQGPEGYLQCEVTGKWLPEDETIEIQGMRVGAEGKEILLEQLRSGEGTGEKEKPTVLRRWGCMIIDGLIMGVVFVLISAVGGGVIGALTVMYGDELEEDTKVRLISLLPQVASLLYGVVVLAYYTYFHGVKGQTPGKMVGHLYVVNPDGSPIGVKTAFWRAVFYNGPSMLMAFLLIVGIGLMPLTSLDIITTVASLLVSVYLLVDVIVALVDTKQQRALHDMLAKTRVVHVDKE